jgi:hypothetical protein
MFEVAFPPTPSGPTPPRPAPLDILPPLPVLRAEVTEIEVEMLAIAAAENALCARQRAIENLGHHADYRDHNHPIYAAAQGPQSPVLKFAEAQVALSDACHRHCEATGWDGLALARRRITSRYNAAVADCVLERLENRTIDDEIDDLLAPGPQLIRPRKDGRAPQADAG